MVAAAAAALFVSCTQEIEQPVNEEQVAVSARVDFKAEISEPATRATLTTEDEKSFKAAWEGTDQVSLYALSDTFEETAPAMWDTEEKYFSASFTGTVPTTAENWMYAASYPYTETGVIPFGSDRVQKGNAYNSAYDIMYGEQSYEGALLGKDAEGNNFVIPMQRLTGIAYFHITGDLDEEVVSATLEAEGIAVTAVKVDNNGTLDYADDADFVDAITITFDQTTEAPKASDLKLWFNVLPGDYNGLTLTITTATKTATLKNTQKLTYTAGKLNKAVLSNLNWKDKPAYRKITRTEELDEGNYLIVYEEDGVAFDGSLEKLDAGNNVAKVTIAGGAIMQNETVDASSFAIVPVEGGYSIQSANGYFIGQSAYTNGLTAKAEYDSDLANTISFDSNGNAVIVGKGSQDGSNVTLRFNKSSGDSNYRFRYYKSGQEAIALYKFDDGKQPSGITFAEPELTFVLNSDDYSAFEGQQATLAEGNTAAIRYSMSGDALGTINENDGSIELDGTTTGTATITATAAASDNFRRGSTTYTITVENAAKTLSQITDTEAGVTVKNVTVMAKDGSNVILKDASGLALLYASNSFAPGDFLNTLVGDVTLYEANNILQFSTITSYDKAADAVTVNHGEAVEFSSIASTLASAPAVRYVHAIGTKANRTITVGDNALRLSSTNSVVADGPVEIYGYVIGYSSQFSNHTIIVTSLEPYIDPDKPILDVTPNELGWLYNETDAKSITITLNENGSVTKTESNMSWATVTLEGNTLTVTPNDENSSTTQDNKGTITLTHNDNSDLVKVITCTQEKKVNLVTKNVTFTVGTDITSTSAVTKQNVKFEYNKDDGQTEPAYYNPFRWYKESTVTISSTISGYITQVVVHFQSGYAKTLTPDSGKYSLNSTTGTWTSNGNVSSVVLDNKDAAARFTSIDVTYTADASNFVQEATTISLSKGETSDDPITVKAGKTVDLLSFITTNNTAGEKTFDTEVSSAIATLSGSIVTGVAVGGPFVVTLDIAATEDYSAAATMNIYVEVVSAGGTLTPDSDTWDLTTGTYTSVSEDLIKWASGKTTFAVAKNTGTRVNNYLGGSGSYNHTRFYTNNIITVTPESGVEITSIEITCTGNTYTSPVAGTWYNATASTSNSVVTITPMDGTKACSHTVTNTTRITKIIVNYQN